MFPAALEMTSAVGDPLSKQWWPQTESRVAVKSARQACLDECGTTSNIYTKREEARRRMAMGPFLSPKQRGGCRGDVNVWGTSITFPWK